MAILAMLTISCKKDNLSNQLLAVTTSDESNITKITATCGENIFSEGSTTVTAKGIAEVLGVTRNTECASSFSEVI